MLDQVSTPNPVDLSQEKSKLETGVVKWFNDYKNYGFVASADGSGDALLHVVTLLREGYSTVPEGATVIYEAATLGKGRQVFRIHSVDRSTAKVVQPARANSVKVVTTEGPVKVTCKWFNRVRGFGFLTMDDGRPDIFVHMEILRLSGIEELRADQIVNVWYGTSEGGLMATKVELQIG